MPATTSTGGKNLPPTRPQPSRASMSGKASRQARRPPAPSTNPTDPATSPEPSDDPTWKCNCPDFLDQSAPEVGQGRKCKHILAVMMAIRLREEALEAITPVKEAA